MPAGSKTPPKAQGAMPAQAAQAATGVQGARSPLFDQARRGMRRKMAVLAVVLVLVSLATLPLGSHAMLFHSLDDILSAFGMAAQLVGDAVGSGKFYTQQQVTDACPQFYDVWGRVATLYICILCGGMLALSGSLYQTVFRNPIAAPTMLGVGNGVTFGVIILVLLYGVDAAYHVGEHYLLCYLCAIVILGVVIGIAVAIGHGEPSVTDMLLVGTVLSGLLAQVIVFFSYFVFTDEQWDVYTQVNEVLAVSTDALSLGIITLVFLVGTVPVVVARFRLNLVAFDPQDMRMSGSSPTKLRFLALGCATVLIIGAQVHVGTVAMVALGVPFLSRLVFGAEFSKQTWGDLLLGAIMLVVCNGLVSLCNILLYQSQIYISLPIGLVANLVTLPLFAWIMASQKRGWE